VPHFTDADVRRIISDTYEKVQPSTAVAETLYAPAELATLPPGAVALAVGVNHPVRHAGLVRGETVLDIGCGAGIDTLLAAHAVGPDGHVVGLDMTPAMLDRARRHVAESGADNVEIREGVMEALPFADASFDVIVSNGVLNLSTRKSRALAEMLRILRPGGRLSLGDLVLADALPEALMRDPTALAV
jgi:arsenite methyltransferase